MLGSAIAGARWTEIVSREGADADDATASLQYLDRAGGAYVASGLLLLVATGALVVAALAVRALLGPGLWVDAVTVVAVLGAGGLGLAGVVHVSSPGPLAYIASLDPAWGDAGYIAGQTIGNQGAYAAGLLGLAVWQLGVAVLAWRRRVLPRWLAVFALPAAIYVVGLVMVLTEVPEPFFLANLVSLLVGLPLWCAVTGVALLIRMRRQPVPRTSS